MNKSEIKAKRSMIIDILDNKVKNLEPSFRNIALRTLMRVEFPTSKDKKFAFVKEKLNITQGNQRHIDYWKLRGWDTILANFHRDTAIKEYRATHTMISPYSREFWMTRINPESGIFFTPEEADFERNSRRPIRAEYWIKKGHSPTEAVELAKQAKLNNDHKGGQEAKNQPDELIRSRSKRCVEYWLLRGYSQKEAEEAVSLEQTTFSLDICIEKHGKIEGTRIWQERQDKWQATLTSKEPEEIARINSAKVSKGRSVSLLETSIFEAIQQTFPNAEKQFNLSREGKRNFIYDIKLDDKIIEIQGDYWHCNPFLYKEDYYHTAKKLYARDVWAKDAEKAELAAKNGFQLLAVWEHDFNNNQQDVIDQCIKFLSK